MILVCRNEISTCPAEMDFKLRLRGEIEFHPGKTGQFPIWYLLSPFVMMKFQPVQPEQSLPYDCMGKSNFIPARRDSFPLPICIQFLIIFLCKHVSLQNSIDSH